MDKIILLYFLLYAGLYAQESQGEKQQLENQCLQCHMKHQIPNELIYQRYLMKYSTADGMGKAIKEYLKHPKKENSIMPLPFFLKFPMKEALVLDDENLEKNIRMFLDMYDVKKKLVLP
ncbi:MAG: hypothetical protein OQK45_07305 [Sulfurovum sp.]|nr:hypothetical protein [Sulfurovum sp.]